MKRQTAKRSRRTTTEEIKSEDKQEATEHVNKSSLLVFLNFLKPQYYSPLHDAHGVGRVNTTSFTFESSVSSQGPLPKEDPVGVCVGAGVGEG